MTPELIHILLATVAAGALSVVAAAALSLTLLSRIVPRLAAPSITGDLADVVVTEHGVARLKSVSGRARAAAASALTQSRRRC